MSDLDPKKLDRMWEEILYYEQNEAYFDKLRDSLSKIEGIIKEVYKQCF